jgi:phage-related protein
VKLAEIFVGIRPDERQLPADMRRALNNANTERIGRDEGGKFSKGFGSGLGKLGAAAAAGLATLQIGRQLKDSVTAASDLNETVSKTQQVFGKSAAEIEKFGDKAPTALGQSKQAALDANATFGLFGKTAGLSGKGLVGFTTNLTTLASDLASFNNTTPEQAIEAIGAALRGEAEPIRAYGVLLDDATLKAEGMRLGLVKASKDTDKIQAAQIRAEVAQRNYNKAVKEHGKNSTEAQSAQAGLLSAQNTLKKLTEGTVPPLTQQQRVLAANSVIMRQTSAAQGDFARTSAGLANQQRIASAQVSQLKVAIGNALLPVVLQGATVLNQKLLPPLIDLAEKHGPKVAKTLSSIATGAGPAITKFFADLGPKIASFRDGTNEAAPALTSLADSGSKLAPVVQDLLSKVPSLTDVLKISATAIGFLADHTDTLSQLMPLLVAGIVAYKVAQLAANVAQAVNVPTKIAEVVVNRQLVRSNRELIASRAASTAATAVGTGATAANTVATSTNATMTLRQRAAAIASSIAQKAVAVATAVWTGAQWLLNAALSANPIGIVIGLAALLALGIVALWKKSETFRDIVTKVWEVVRKGAEVAFKAIVDKITSVISWITTNVPPIFKAIVYPFTHAGELISAAWEAIKTGAKNAIKFVVDKFLGLVQTMIEGAAKAFGWVPGLGPKLKTAATEFAKFRDSVNAKLDGLKDQTVNVTPNIANVTSTIGGIKRTVPLNVIGSFGRAATGGRAGTFKVNGPGTTTSDTAGLFALSKKEWVFRAAVGEREGDAKMQALNEGRATIVPDGAMARGGPVVGAQGRFPSPRGLTVWQREVAAHTATVARPAAIAIANSTAQKMVDAAYAMGGDSGPPGSRRNFRGVTLNDRTIRMLRMAESLLKATFHITQGSYSTRVAASGSTHAGGGAMDTDGPRGWNVAVAALRKAGFAAWHRTPSQGPWNHHIHSIAIGDPTASPAAKRQVASFKRGGTGLGMFAGGNVGDFIKQSGIPTYDEGGRANGTGLFAKGINAPERMLSPRQTEAFEKLVELLENGSIGGSPVVHNHFPATTGAAAEEAANRFLAALGGS